MGLFDFFKKRDDEEEEQSWEENTAWDENESDYEDENISVYEAADIWLSNGKDEDYMFGYSEEELEEAARQS